MKAEVFYPAQCYLGEGPVWHAARRACFWVDIENDKFYEYDWARKSVKERILDYRVTLAVPDRSGGLILGLEGGLGRYDLDRETFTWLADLEKDKYNHRCNDGKADASGRLWVGTMHRGFETGAGGLYSFEAGGRPKKQLPDLTIPNGMAWTRDNRRFYFIDSPTRKVRVYRFDLAAGTIVFERDAVVLPEGLGDPDGMTIDEEGMLWVAHWGGFGVYRWNPDTGQLLDKIEVPVPNVSSCAFVGDDLDHLLITTARQDLDDAALAKYPASGDVFLQKMPVRGLPAQLFGG